jgi:nicotinamidase-related amidase
VIAEVRPGDDVLTLPADAADEDAREVARRAVHEGRPVFIQKTEFSVFEGNRSANAFVQTLVGELGGRVEFVVCGVATDVCVRQAVEGMLDRDLEVRVVPDATWSLGLLPSEKTIDAWGARGAARTLSTKLDEVS